MNAVKYVAVIARSRASTRGLVTRSSGLDEMLHNGGVGHGNCCHHKAHGDSRDRGNWNNDLAERWIDQAVAYRNVDNVCEGISMNVLV